MVDNKEKEVESLPVKKDKQDSDVFGPVYGVKKLWVKLKIPKDDLGKKIDEQEDQMKINSNDTERVCAICGIAFKSGKALGGHMRIHVQQSKDQDRISKSKTIKVQEPIEFKEKEKDSKSSGHKSMIINEPVCSICGKSFPSLKSLYGHMKSHPERDWRGIHPPPSVSKNSSSSSLSEVEPPPPPPVTIDDQMEDLFEAKKKKAVNLINELWSWKVTAKRGRRSVDSEVSSSEEDAEVLNAANELMLMATGVGEFEAANSFSKSKALDIDHLVSKSKKQKFDQYSPMKQLENGDEYCSSEVENGNLYHEESVEGQVWLKEKNESSYSSDDDIQFDNKSAGHELIKDPEKTNSNAVLKNKKKRKKVKLSDLSLAHHDKYSCKPCGKSFPTFQALGGHMSSHTNKLKSMIQNSIDESDKPSSNLIAQEQELENNGVNDVSSAKSHKKIHGSELVEASPNQVESPGESSHTCHRVLDINLNEMPHSC